MSAAADRRTSSGTRDRLVSGQLGLVFLSEFSTLASFDLLLSVTPATPPPRALAAQAPG